MRTVMMIAPPATPPIVPPTIVPTGVVDFELIVGDADEDGDEVIVAIDSAVAELLEG
jgi:hypothetical protein